MGDLNKKRAEILIVEDSRAQSRILQNALEKSNFSVSRASNGKEALAYLVDHTPTVIISDVIMPVMNGFEFCKCIKTDEKLKRTPVMLLTTLSEPEDVIRGLESGADNFLTKPYDEQTLISCVNHIVDNIEISKKKGSDTGIEIAFAGNKCLITSNRVQMLDLLLSIYQNAMLKKRELEKTVQELRKANKTITTMRGLIQICSSCKKIRNDQGYWEQIEMYIQNHSEAEFTHGVCPECSKKLYPDHTA
ncbi:MAG TPA: response regulator [Syntrophorhabdaceae bacterium]|nr:response regulator [Syntrophorhabdaceae bacterium]